MVGATANAPSSPRTAKASDAPAVPASDASTQGSAQESATIAALLSQGQLPQGQLPQASVPLAEPIDKVSSGTTRAGSSSVSGVGAFQTLSPQSAGNGIFSTGFEPKAGSNGDATDPSSSPDKLPSFGIGGSADTGSGAGQGQATQTVADPQADPAAAAPQPAAGDPARSPDLASLLALQPQTAPGKADRIASAGDDVGNGVSAAGATGAAGDSGLAGLTLLHGGTAGVPGSHATGTTLATTYVMSQTPADQVSIVMQRAASNGERSMTISLDPVELGRVQVKLDIAKDGSVQASITADRPETLSLLRNDHQTLTQALQSAGLSADSSSLSFNLSDSGGSNEGRQSQQSAQNGSASSSHAGSSADAEIQQLSATTFQYAVSSGAAGRVDVLV